jgi:hypothetical protein
MGPDQDFLCLRAKGFPAGGGSDHRADAVVTPMAIAPPITLRATAARPRTGRPGPAVAPHHRITRQPLDRLQQ